ncbi:hypothetical protein BCV69DRAFT_306656 [Microstroma glucosiphilum]|uniref:Protein kinase domain-containing protein n=1 Tax=Pseudomicrostroma glucosiphilum TaxID=1684307 RepID=A0A316UBA8_9BASI|nr:hypothetical protein BCV69DRAFT_306656 [Pseudomicrostroma glucosiphilum]PWN22449.1 hypothetical protein BCV69DRAFT_306656 [Pseudomicrostroma glucosiphilum]
MAGGPTENQHIINMMGDPHFSEAHNHHRHHQQAHQQHLQHTNAAAHPGGSPYASVSSPGHRSPLPHGASTNGPGFDQLDSTAASAYATPRLSLSAAPSSSKDSLSRSLSLGGAGFGQHQSSAQHLQQRSSPGRSSYASPASSSIPLYSSAMPPASSQMVSSSSRSGASHKQSLLPTIATPYSTDYQPRSPVPLDNGLLIHPRPPSQGFAPQQSSYASGYPVTSAERPPSGFDGGGGSTYQRLEAGYGGMGSGVSGSSAGKARNVEYAPLNSHSRQASPAGASGDQAYARYYASQAGLSHQNDAGKDSLPYAYTARRSSGQQGINVPSWSSPSQPTTALPHIAPPPARGYSQQQWDDPQGMALTRSTSGKVRATEEKRLLRIPPPPKEEGLRRIRDLNDLRPKLDQVAAATTRRADPAGGFVSPLKAMTSYLHHTYHLVNPSFIYELSFNPRRVLTKPSKPMHNNGHDNEDSDYILYVNDWLGNEEGNRYLILDILGQGTFGQVVKCQNMRTHEIVAVKVIKNKPAYYKQSMMEVTILEMLNVNWDPEDKHHILRLRDTFIHAEHLCLVFELLSSNLYELIKQNSFRGLSTSLVRVFTTQLLDALTVLNEANLIHCDLKPENILLRTLQTPSIKLVDFGSACHEKQTVYTYIQSRFYRSPEVLLGLPYNSAIDMWSLGCIAVELFLGLPLFPGTSEYNQMCRIVEMLGLPPAFMLEQGKQTGEFFNVFSDDYGRKSYRLKSREQYTKEHPQLEPEQPSKVYFSATTLPEIIKTYPLSRKSGRPADAQKEMANRASFVDFVTGLLDMDPHERWTPQEAVLHPFITGEKFVKAFKPPRTTIEETRPSSSRMDPNKHQFGGLPQTNTRASGRAYHDAAAYNQHLAQQQAYNTAHKVRQSVPVINNPYAQDQAVAASAQAKAQQQQAHAHAQAQAQAHAHAQLQAAQAHAAMIGYGGTLPGLNAVPATGVPAASNGKNGTARSRSDTYSGPMTGSGAYKGGSLGINTSGMDASTTPSREEWERRQQQQQQRQQNGGAQSMGPSQYVQLDLLQPSGDGGAGWQQQAHGQGAGGNWLPQTTSPSYTSPRQGSSQTPSRQYQGGQPNFSVIVEGAHDRQSLQHTHDAAAALAAARNSPSAMSPQAAAEAAARAGSVGAPSSAAYASSNRNPSTSARYGTSSATAVRGGGGGGAAGVSSAGRGGQFSPNSSAPFPFDAFDSAQPSIAQLMPALKPQQYHAGSAGSAGSSSTNLQQLQPQRHSMILPPSGMSGYRQTGGGAGAGSGGGAGLRLSSPLSGGLSPTSAGFDDHFVGGPQGSNTAGGGRSQGQALHPQQRQQQQQQNDRRYSSHYTQQQPDLTRF